MRQLDVTRVWLLAALLAAPAAWAQDASPTDTDADADESSELDTKRLVAEAVRPGLVQVEYTLRYDKGDSPVFHGGTNERYGVGIIEQERPLETRGYLVAPTKVVLGDLILHPRFIEEIRVRFGDDVVSATPAAYSVDRDAILLDLERPLATAEPLAFDAAAEGPYLRVNYVLYDAEWTVRVGSFSPQLARTVAGREFQVADANALIVAEDGTPVAYLISHEIAPDDSWKGSPLQWDWVAEPQMAEQLAELEQRTDTSLLRVALNFRSPKKQAQVTSGYTGPGQIGTEMNVVGVLIGPRRLLVLADLEPKVTARLERIRIYPGQGEPVEATFVGSLADYGALVAELAEPLPDAAPLDTADIRGRYNQLLLMAQVTVQGDNRVGYFLRNRITSFYKGWRENIYPGIPGDEEGVFLFDADGALVALPIAHRPKTSIQQSRGRRVPRTTAAAQVAAAIDGADPAAAFDANNVPLTEDQESRLAWMGLSLQRMTRELARANGVSKLTRDGETGAIVSYVYRGSPADEAGVELGWILLRLDVEGEPKPLEATADENIWGGGRPFPWAKWGDLPEEYYDSWPPPWEPAENTFRRALTDVGFGRKYTARFFVDGEIVEKTFEVIESPKHYESAPKFEFEPLGLTVKDLTFELRHYFRKTDENPGVVTSKIEPGSRASVAGLKPYEIITHVNNQPVYTVADFERLVAGQTELRFDVLRMTSGRVVQVELEPAATSPADEPAEPTTAPAPMDAGEIPPMIPTE